jgi:indole-3-glycerol phosphate synthase
MPDILNKLVEDARRRVNGGYYNVKTTATHQPVSLSRALNSAQKNAIIAEIKPISPALGPLRPNIDAVDAAVKLAKGGAVALSVLTEPDNFGGRIDYLRSIREKVEIPILMKDIILHKTQIQAGRESGADCVLLIESVFLANHGPLESLIQYAHQTRLEVLLEVHNEMELKKALVSDADIIGVNNRNLATLETDLNTTIRLLNSVEGKFGKTFISESGFQNASDIRKLKSTRVDGFLIGSSIMRSEDLEGKVREFVLA